MLAAFSIEFVARWQHEEWNGFLLTFHFKAAVSRPLTSEELVTVKELSWKSLLFIR